MLDIINTDNRALSAAVVAALLVGVFKITLTTLSYFSMIFDLFILPPVNFKKYGAKQDKWAVVTGASDGIGKEYAIQLAKKGLNVVLVSRTQSKLELLATEISTKYKVVVKIIAFDASTDAPENYEAIAKAINGLPVTVLINNVGQSHSIPVPFLDTDEKEMNDIITINNAVTLKVTRVVAPVILETVSKEKALRGLILSMGSFSGIFPSPLLATYSGSKFFLQGWSAGLAGELKDKKIDVELMVSYLVTSAMSKVKRPSLLIPTPKQFVASALRNVGRRVGAQEKYATCTPYFSHAIFHWFVENTVGLSSKAANTINLNMHKSIRVRALKKAKRLAEAEKAGTGKQA